MFYYPILLQDKEKLKWYMAEATHSLLFFMSSSSVFDYMARRRFTLFNSSVIIIVIYLPSSLLLCDTSPSTTFFIFLLILIWSICKIYEICFCCFYWFFSPPFSRAACFDAHTDILMEILFCGRILCYYNW